MWWLDWEKYNGWRFDAGPKLDVVNDERCVCRDCWQGLPRQRADIRILLQPFLHRSADVRPEYHMRRSKLVNWVSTYSHTSPKAIAHP